MRQISGEILLVDDEGPLLKLMSVYLRRLGYAVTAVNTVAKAWEHVRLSPGQFAVVVLDAGMAETGVDDLSRQLLAVHPRLRVIVNSGYPVDMGVLQRDAPGRVEFLHKPFSPDMLVAALGRMLGTQEKAV
jgi:DNA-binding NtrC family response regulator